MMASNKSSLFVTLILVGQSAAFAIPDLSHLFRRAPFNVGRYASLGESFASGPSAGDVYDEVTKCRRYKQAQGPQVAADDRIQGPKPITFDFIACSGSKLKNIYQESTGGGNAPGDKPKISQAGALKDKNPDLVTMSIGGNDVGFVDLLDRCVYRFKDLSGCRGCGPFPRWSTNDCTDDCNEAVKGVQEKIDSADFARGLNDAIKAVFQNAPKTKLFITGYPRFWNAEDDACDKVSFKFGCINNSILPLIKDRRAKMNKLTDNLNDKIKNAINNYATGASLTFVDPNPFFEGHRFCEKDVSEPSYRNDKIYFYPFEYWTGGTLNIDAKAASDCQAILDNGGDQGDYFACEMANEVKAGNAMDISNQTNNVQGEVTITSSDSLPDYLARIFHPTINGMTGYRDAIVSAYNAYEAAAGPTPSAPAPIPSPTPAEPDVPAVTLTCTGTGGSKYMNRDGIIKVINNFCDEAVKQGVLDKDSGSIARTYNKDTPEQVDIALDYRPGLNWSPMKDKCVEQMMIVTDGCDTNSNHWKGGGSRKDTDVTYRWNPVNARSVKVEDAKVWGGCDGTKLGSYTIWGAHWAADDFGNELINNIKGKGISPTRWTFDYGGGDDHREWTAKFTAIVASQNQVESSMESVGGWGMDIGCNIHW